MPRVKAEAAASATGLTVARATRPPQPFAQIAVFSRTGSTRQ